MFELEYKAVRFSSEVVHPVHQLAQKDQLPTKTPPSLRYSYVYTRRNEIPHPSRCRLCQPRCRSPDRYAVAHARQTCRPATNLGYQLLRTGSAATRGTPAATWRRASGAPRFA